MSSQKQSPEQALRQGLLDAAVGTMVGTVGNQIGTLYAGEHIDPATHLFLHALVGGVSGTILDGPAGMAAGTLGAGLAAAVTHGFDKPDRALSFDEQQEALKLIADYSSLAAGAGAFGTGQDVSMAISAGRGMAENGLLVRTADKPLPAPVQEERPQPRTAAERRAARVAEAEQVALLREGLIQMSKETSEALDTQGIKLSADKIKEGLQKHPALQGTPEQVHARLIAIGQQQSEQRASSSAAPRSMVDHLAAGIDWVLNTTLNVLIPQAHASKMESTGKPLLKLYDLRLNQASVGRPNAYLNHENAFDRGVIQGNEAVSDVMRHPMERLEDIGLWLFDGVNAMTDLTFGISTQDSRLRSALYGREVLDGCEQFQAFDRAGKVQTLTAALTVGVEAGALGYLAARVAAAEAYVSIRSTASLALKGVGQKIYRGIELTRRSHTARKAADEAFKGGKYSGQKKGFYEQSPKELERSIKKFERRILEHEQKIRDPKSVYENWDQMDYQGNVLYSWKADIQRLATYREMAKQILTMKQMQQTSNIVPLITTKFSVTHPHPVKREEDIPGGGVQPLSELVTREHNLSEIGQPQPWCIAPPSSLIFSEGARGVRMLPRLYTEGRDSLEQESILEGGSKSAKNSR